MLRLFFNQKLRAPLSAEPFYIYIILTRRLFVKRFFYLLTIFDKYAKMLMVPDITVRRLLLERGGDGNDNIAVGIDFNSCIACQCYLSLLHNSE